MGIAAFPAIGFATRDVHVECEVCGALPGFHCFDIRQSDYSQGPYPVQAHMVPRPYFAARDEIPIENQALSSGQLARGS
jgi:hypothetical protein